MKYDIPKKYLKQLSKWSWVVTFLFASCGRDTQRRHEFETKKSLEMAEFIVHDLFESPEFRDAIKNLAPSQEFHNLAQFYGFAYNFDLPGCSESELSDGWKRPIRFSLEGDLIKIWSFGPDGVNQFGEEDDIKALVNIELTQEK